MKALFLTLALTSVTAFATESWRKPTVYASYFDWSQDNPGLPSYLQMMGDPSGKDVSGNPTRTLKDAVSKIVCASEDGATCRVEGAREIVSEDSHWNRRVIELGPDISKSLAAGMSNPVSVLPSGISIIKYEHPARPGTWVSIARDPEGYGSPNLICETTGNDSVCLIASAIPSVSAVPARLQELR